MRNYSWLLLLSFILTGCAPAPIHLHLMAAKNINSVWRKGALPVKVVIFQLKTATAFQQASFYDLWLHGRQTLADGYIKQNAVIINPASKLRLVLQRPKACHYLGVMAVFHRPSASAWRVLYRLPTSLPLLPITVTVSLHGNRVLVEK